MPVDKIGPKIRGEVERGDHVVEKPVRPDVMQQLKDLQIAASELNKLGEGSDNVARRRLKGNDKPNHTDHEKHTNHANYTKHVDAPQPVHTEYADHAKHVKHDRHSDARPCR